MKIKSVVKSFWLVSALTLAILIARVGCPVTVIHGTEDLIIPFAHGQRLFALANEPKRFMAVDGAGHNDLAYRLGMARFEDVFLTISKPPVECGGCCSD